MNCLRLALFDVDGVLLDSLTPHLSICEDKNHEYGLGLSIPTAPEFKKMVRRNKLVISPMKSFFTAVGFPDRVAEKANEQYQKVFMKRYTPAPFPETHAVLNKLSKHLRLGIVSSNVRENVVEALGSNVDFFDRRCIFTKDSDTFSKSRAISAALTTLQARPSETIYVGDQLADWEAANAAGVHFLGVAYGWGISEEDRDFPVAKRPGDVPECILTWNCAPK